MNRRTFTQTLAAAALSAVAAPLKAAPASAESSPKAPPFPLSVMLWTVFTDLPFEERLAKVAEAGYSNVELVGEYSKWSAADFARANTARKRLGIEFDATAGLAHGIADPASRDALLAELRQALTPMETLKRAAALVEGRMINGQPVRLLLECIDPEENPRYFLTSAAEAIEVVRQVNHPQVQFLYDIFHEQIAEGNLIEKLDKHIDVIGLIHVANVPGRHEPGTGEINYFNIYRKLAQLNYKRMVAMEFHPTGDPVATLRAAKALALNAGAI